MKKCLIFLISTIIFLTSAVLPQAEVSAKGYNVDFSTESKALVLINLDTGTTVFEKAPDEKCYPASTTKIMTYIVTVENVKDIHNTKVKVKGNILHMLDGTGSSMAGIEDGETLTVYQLLNCLMVHSGNDAALVLADYVGNGDISAFVEKMNAKAKELGCKNTHFMNPHGLHDPDHYSTANDLAKIAQYAMTLPEFSEITNTVVSDCLGDDRLLVTTNYMIDDVRGGDYYYPYARGIKTGTTGTDSGYCLVSSAMKDGYSYLCVALGAQYEDSKGEQLENGAMKDSKKLYEWAFDNLEIKTIIDENTLVDEVDLKYAWNKDKLKLAPATSYSTILPEEINTSSIDMTYDLPESVDAPVRAGQKIGTVTLSYANQELTKIDLVSSETVERSELLTALSGIGNVISSGWFIAAVIVIVILFVIYIIISTIYGKRRKNKRTVKKYRRL